MATSVISNTVLDPNGGVVAGAVVQIRLMPSGGYRISTFTEVARLVSTVTNASGFWSLALERNSNITPANSWYEVTELVPDTAGGKRVYNIAVGVPDESLLASLVTPAEQQPTVVPAGTVYLDQASADARYQALGSLGAGIPTTVDAGDTGTAGVATSASRSDHEHPVSITTAQLVPAATIAAWATWAPTWTNLTVGNGVVIAKFVQLGKTVHFRIKVTFGTTSAMGTGPTFTFPVTAAADYVQEWALGNCTMVDNGVKAYSGFVQLNSTTSGLVRSDDGLGSFSNTAAGVPFAWGTGDYFMLSGTYEAA